MPTRFSKRSQWGGETNALTVELQKLKNAGVDIADLTIANPTLAGIPYPAHLLESVRYAHSQTYDPHPRGLLAARTAIAGATPGCSPDQVILHASTSEAYGQIFMTLCDEGDEVVIGAPSYPLLSVLAQLNHVALRTFEFCYDGQWHIDRRSLLEQITARTRAIIVVNPNNPTGAYVSQEDWAFLATLGLPLISDEVFFNYPLELKTRCQSASQIDAELTFTLNGLSKLAGLPQAKLAWTIVSGRNSTLVSQALERLELISDTYLSASTWIQTALPELLVAARPVQLTIRSRLEENLRALDVALVKAPSVTRLAAEGGWYAVLKLATIHDDETWALKWLREAHVYAHPGWFFDFNRGSHMVVSLLTPPQVFANGVGRALACAETEVHSLP